MIHRKYEHRYRNSRALVLSAGKHIMLVGRIAAPLDRHAPFIESGLTALDDLDEIMPCTVWVRSGGGRVASPRRAAENGLSLPMAFG
jgi:hypothetical protein